MDSEEKKPALASFEETRRWQIIEFSKLSVEKKINFLGEMFELMKNLRSNGIVS